jgi:hypothetical protein
VAAPVVVVWFPTYFEGDAGVYVRTLQEGGIPTPYYPTFPFWPDGMRSA